MDGITGPLQFFLDPSKRIYWGYAFTAILIASLATTYQRRSFDPRSQLLALTNPHYWFNRSTLVDYALMFINSLIRTSLIIPALGARLSGALIVGAFLQVNVGDVQIVSSSWLFVAILFSGTLFLADDASRFLLHREMHRWPLLWRMHRVHHSAVVLTPFTVFRVHPIESIVYSARGFIVFSLVAGIFIWLFKGQLTALELLGVDALGFIFNMAAANLRHSHVRLSFGPLEGLFISPTQHQIHHSVYHQDVNFGSCFSLWDNFSGTLVRSRELPSDTKLKFGLNEPLVRGRNIKPMRETSEKNGHYRNAKYRFVRFAKSLLIEVAKKHSKLGDM
jgi:sterol desaturase/sphingolipid hydroxylase (fatty acid hydroxylase superfamily)